MVYKCSWPKQTIFNRGNEFLEEFIHTVKRDYGTKRKPTTTTNPQANNMLERFHQSKFNLYSLQKKNHQYHVGDKILYMSKYSENPYDGLYAIVHTKHQWYCMT